MGERIEVEADTYEVLERLKGPDETFDDLVRRLVKGRPERVRAGSGLWEGTAAAEAVRATRMELNNGIANEPDGE